MPVAGTLEKLRHQQGMVILFAFACMPATHSRVPTHYSTLARDRTATHTRMRAFIAFVLALAVFAAVQVQGAQYNVTWADDGSPIDLSVNCSDVVQFSWLPRHELEQSRGGCDGRSGGHAGLALRRVATRIARAPQA